MMLFFYQTVVIDNNQILKGLQDGYNGMHLDFIKESSDRISYSAIQKCFFYKSLLENRHLVIGFRDEWS